ncbi:MAG: tRNA (adenine-N1)-methyltransferase [Chloroflexi bacterium]|nr:tRNA (adenine-N1)-methyltransferase [Chloroflexota bacterium]
MPKPLSPGDHVVLYDPKGRPYTAHLVHGREFHAHLGMIKHDDIIGKAEGSRITTHTGHDFLVLRMTLEDYLMNMKRASTIIYPKDIGPILMYGDIYPGATVVEAGIGSGALTMALLRAVGAGGRVISYEVREDMANQAMKHVRSFMGETPNHTLHIGDIYEGIQEQEVDRVVLDVPEPWRAIEPVANSLRTGGVWVVYLPTVLQVYQLHQEITKDRRFELLDSFEVMQRPWHFAETSARPGHRMVAHTGFLTRATRCEPRESSRPMTRRVLGGY